MLCLVDIVEYGSVLGDMVIVDKWCMDEFCCKCGNKILKDVMGGKVECLECVCMVEFFKINWLNGDVLWKIFYYVCLGELVKYVGCGEVWDVIFWGEGWDVGKGVGV